MIDKDYGTVYAPVEVPYGYSKPVDFKTDQTAAKFEAEIKKNQFGSPYHSRQWNTVELERISTTHGRSVDDRILRDAAMWSDQYGNIFGSRSYKGAPLNDVGIITYDSTARYGLRINGLKDSLVLARIFRASDFLREHGLETERITGMEKVTHVPIKNHIFPIEEWKKAVVRQARNLLGKKGEILVQTDAFSKYLDRADFYVLDREMQVSERLVDLHQMLFFPEMNDKIIIPNQGDFELAYYAGNDIHFIFSRKQLQFRLQKIFNWVNTYELQHGRQSGFDAYNNKSVLRYFQEYLPDKIGNYLGRLNGLGIVHGYASWHNWSAVGTLYDLDSVHGKPLFNTDDSISNEDQKRDVLLTIDAIRTLYGDHSNRNIVTIHGQQFVYNGYLEQISKQSNDVLRNEATVRFLKSYIRSLPTHFTGKDPSVLVKKLKTLLNDCNVLTAREEDTLHVDIPETVFYDLEQQLSIKE